MISEFSRISKTSDDEGKEPAENNVLLTNIYGFRKLQVHFSGGSQGNVKIVTGEKITKKLDLDDLNEVYKPLEPTEMRINMKRF